DLLDIAGDVTVAGALCRLNAPPATQDAPVVGRLRAAGAVILGRTNMTEFAFSALGTNPHFGIPGNPADLTRVPGGSSSGAAASVGYGVADMGVGSDTGGSIRIPAALCGLTGFKPTGGVVPIEGCVALSTTLDTIGPIARDVATCAAAFAIMAGRPDPLTSQPPLPVTGLRIGLVHDTAVTADMEPEVAAAITAAEERLRAAGAVTEVVDFTAVVAALRAIDALGTFPSVELAAALDGASDETIARIDPRIWARVRPGYDVRATTYIAMHARRREAIALMTKTIAGFDAFAMPTVPITAPTIADMDSDEAFVRANGLVLRNTRMGNLLDLPGVSLPVPSAGLPVGWMLCGARGTDDRLLRVAAAVEGVVG
ncbi:amidase family protein, partial [Ameyamaea chiangmaiensis]